MITLSKELDRLIVTAREKGNSFKDIMEKRFKLENVGCEKGEHNLYGHPFLEVTAEKLALALIDGYEVELSPGEIIAKDYKKAVEEKESTADKDRKHFINGYLYGVQETLRVLETIVEGVNDNE